MTKTKTVHEIIQEYLNRQKKLDEMSVTSHGHYLGYDNVSNLKITGDGIYENWIEFDYRSKIDGTKKHEKIEGRIVRYVQKIEE